MSKKYAGSSLLYSGRLAGDLIVDRCSMYNKTLLVYVGTFLGSNSDTY